MLRKLRGTYKIGIATALVAGGLGAMTGGVASASARAGGGELVIHVSGLSQNARVDVVLSGPVGTRIIDRTGTIKDLPAGTYTLAPHNVTVAGGAEYGESAIQVKLVAHHTRIANVAYLLVPSSGAPIGAPTTTSPGASTSNGLIRAGDSKTECAIVTVQGTPDYTDLEAAVSDWDSTTGTSVTCIGAYLNGAQNWSQWTSPWVGAPQYGYTEWVGNDPNARQLVLQVDLIPDSLEDVSNPLSWETSCAEGDFNSYATQLGQSLVADGLGDSVIRLGAEANGTWEADFIGKTTLEQNLWATCFANEVTGMRAAAGGHFLFDWNTNACTGATPYNNYYPGNDYVDILGLDLYDVGCMQPKTALSFSQLSAEQYGLNVFETFAASVGKPMSFPEWGLASSPSGDDPSYVTGMLDTVASRDFAFQEYFDVVAGAAIQIDASTPKALAAYRTHV